MEDAVRMEADDESSLWDNLLARMDAEIPAPAVGHELVVNQPARGLILQPASFLGGSLESREQFKARLDRLASAPWKVIDLETTGLTPYSVPVKGGRGTDTRLRARILSAAWPSADNTRLELCAWDFDTLRPDQQLAVAKAALKGIFIGHNALFDLRWLRHVVRQSTTNIDRLWPDLVLDTLSLGRQLLPEGRRILRVAGTQPGDPRYHWIGKRLLKDRGKENWGGTLEDLVYALNLPWASSIDKSYQKPANWILPAPLSMGHYRYVCDDAFLPAVALARLLGDGPVPATLDPTPDNAVWVAQTLAVLAQRLPTLRDDPRLHVYFRITEPAIRHLVDITDRGLPWDQPGALLYKNQHRDNLKQLVDEFVPNTPALHRMVEHQAILGDLTVGNPEQLTKAWVASFHDFLDNPREFPTTASGEPSLSAKDLRRTGMHKRAPEVYEGLTKIQRAKKMVSMVDNLNEFGHRAAVAGAGAGVARDDREHWRLHPMLGFGPGTDRLSATDPNTQNLPGEGAFRALVRARPGHKIITLDYGQIELRIAAGLALRAQKQIIEALRDPMGAEHAERVPIAKLAVRNVIRIMSSNNVAQLQAWEAQANKAANEHGRRLSGLMQIYAGELHDPVLENLAYQDVKDKRDMARLVLFAARVRLRQIALQEATTSALATTFREGLDPHTFTGLDLALKGGHDIGAQAGEDVLAVMRRARDAGGMEALKKQFKTQRQSAKAVNFGLLYGMTAPTLHITGVVTYYLDWDLPEAEMASDAWFALYPEIGLWQYWTILRPEWEDEGLICKVDSKTSQAKLKSKKLRSWRAESLYGRVYVREGFREALNYQDQGTGAQMILLAIDETPKTYRQYLINQIHDELLLEVPDERVDQTKKHVEKAMIKAGDVALAAYDIPIEADGHVDEFWTKD